jgi:hypothetical protein
MARHDPNKLAATVGEELATERNLRMLEVVAKRNKNATRAPLSRAVIDRLRMQRTRGDKKSTVAIPPSVKVLLAYDAGLVLTWRPVFEMHEKALRGRGGTLNSSTMTEVYRMSSVAKGYRDLTKRAEADMPAIIELGIASDQRVFLYVADEARDEDGEYPILRFDDEPCTWISAGCLQDELLAWGCGELEKVPGAAARRNKAEKTVAHWLAREPEQRWVETDDD